MSIDRTCIFSSYCTASYCDMSCVKNTMSQILMEKSDLDIKSPVLSSDYISKERCVDIVKSSFGKHIVLQVKNSAEYAELLTFSVICEMCEGHGSSVTVYHLRYSRYIQMLRDSWSSGVSSQLREIQAFILSSHVLIISSLDYLQFKDFECQTLLNLLQDRKKSDKSTVLVLHDPNSLAGSGPFFLPLKECIKEAVKHD